MRHSQLPLAAGKTEADGRQRDDTDLGAFQHRGMRRAQLLCVLPPAAHSGSTAQCAAGKTGFPDLEEAGAKPCSGSPPTSPMNRENLYEYLAHQSLCGSPAVLPAGSARDLCEVFAAFGP